eukprot:TRINITY_DN9825_c0_g1_i5.p1 TRINITY_DN9825_c0_g1~~TRINITY_DN9825_c0_g1_i5.p1  ORF type:complete len:154 (+),score=25.37 TRINITY_DN9825_c0_g1_i5:157-618(+)
MCIRDRSTWDSVLSYYKKLQLNIPLTNSMLDQIAIIELYLQLDLNLFPFIIDSTGIFALYMQQSKKENLITERYIKTEETLPNIEQALKQGLTLIVEDPNQELFFALQPILNWREESMHSFFLRYLNVMHEDRQEQIIDFNRKLVENLSLIHI